MDYLINSILECSTFHSLNSEVTRCKTASNFALRQLAHLFFATQHDSKFKFQLTIMEKMKILLPNRYKHILGPFLKISGDGVAQQLLIQNLAAVVSNA
jgi:hypothetical protein